MRQLGFHIISAIVGMFWFPLLLYSQNSASENQVEAIIESVADGLDEQTEVLEVVEILEGYGLQPLNINTATTGQLSHMHLLNDIQIKKLLEYRDRYGPVLTIFELNTIDGFYPELLKRLEPFIYFGAEEHTSRTFKDIVRFGKHEMMYRTSGLVQKSRGYILGENGAIPYAGSRFRQYARYRYRAGDIISMGFLGEKDPGEPFFRGDNPKGFDFYSGHLSVRSNSFIQSVIVGDYIVRSGQGLVVWQGFGLGKSLFSMNIAKTGQGIRPYTSSDENQFFRGAAATLKAGTARVDVFVSNKMRDGNILGSDTLGYYFTSLQSSGYHRTHSETEDKNRVGDFNTGISGTWQSGNVKIGAVYLYRHFNFPFNPTTQLYNKFYLSGTSNSVAGIDYLFNKGKYQLFGETARSNSGGIAFLQGVLAHLHDQIQLSVLFRHFDKQYHSLWAAPFSENGTAANETGLYVGARLLPVKYVSVSAYSDLSRSEWIKYSTAGPGIVQDVLVQADFNPPGRFQMYLRYKNEMKDQKDISDERFINRPEQIVKRRLHIQYELSSNVTLKGRIEHAFYKGADKEDGVMIYQDVQYGSDRFPVNLTTRMAFFNTHSYNSRIYAYENDLLYACAIPPYFGRGVRGYFNLKYMPWEKISVWLKVGHTIRTDTDVIGTGYNEIPGNQKTELKFQLRLKM